MMTCYRKRSEKGECSDPEMITREWPTFHLYEIVKRRLGR
jgi:hypothetical protein